MRGNETEFRVLQYDVKAFDFEYPPSCLAKGERHINGRNQLVKDPDIRPHRAQLLKYLKSIHQARQQEIGALN